MSTTGKIEALLQRPPARPPAEVIKLDDADADAVFAELTEYVVTAPIRAAWRRILGEFAAAPADAPEDIGVWVSGFFGSGKSSFAKNLGYAVEDREVRGHHAGELLMRQVADPDVRALLDSLHARVKTEVVMFDVNLDRAEAGSMRPLSISHYLYRNLLRHLDYGDLLEVAELEFALEEQGELDRFVAHFEGRLKEAWERDPARYGEALAQGTWRWRVRRDGADVVAQVSTRLHEMMPKTYPTTDHYAKSRMAVEVTPKFLVDRSFAMMKRRRPGKGLMFVVDEVGGYVARSVDRIEDLRVVIEQFGKVSRQRLKAREIPAPTWVVVTSQEKLSAVVDYIDSKRGEIARLQDRFPQRLRVDLEPSDIQEVVSQRVLAKTPDGDAALRRLFDARPAEIAERFRLEKTQRETSLDAGRFARFYPYPPHFLGLSIEVVNSLRLQDRGGSNTTAGGSNRTLIRQAHAMLTSPTRDGEPALKDLPVGRLVTLDRVCDVMWSNLSSEQKTEIEDVQARFPGQRWPARVAKALCLLHQVRDLPRTEVNLAAVLWDGLDHPSAVDAVRAALKVLSDADFVRLGDEGWTLQNRAEKSWSEKRRGIDPTLGERNERLREAVKAVFEEPGLSRFVYKNFRTLKVGLTVDDHDLSAGQLPVHVVTAASPEAMRGAEGVLTRTWTRSQESASRATAYWVWARTPRVDEVLVRLLQSEKLAKDEHTRGYGPQADTEVRALLVEEDKLIQRLKGELDAAVREALTAGVGVFRTEQTAAADAGGDLAKALSEWLEAVVPQLYPHLEAGAKPLKGTEAEDLLKSASLAGLPEVFYAPPRGLDLVVTRDGRQVAHVDAPVVKLVLGWLREKHAYGTKVTGKMLESEFTGVGYAWDVELVQVVLALLLRAGHVEMTHQGVRFQSTQAGDPRARLPFTSKPAFRAASFAPRTTPGTKVLVKAASQCEALTGEEVDIEESAIAAAFQKVVRAERERVAPAVAVARALALPLAQELGEQEEWWRNVENGASDDTVKLLAEEGAALVERRQRLAKLVDALKPERVAAVTRARAAAEGMAGEILARAAEPAVEDARREVRSLVETGQWIDAPQRLADLAAAIEARHAALRAAAAAALTAAREDAERALQAMPDWAEVPEGRRGAILEVLKGAGAPATIDAIDAEGRAVEARAAALREEVLRVARPERRTVRVAAAPEAVVLTSATEVEAYVAALRRRLLDALGEGDGAAVLLE